MKISCAVPLRLSMAEFLFSPNWQIGRRHWLSVQRAGFQPELTPTVRTQLGSFRQNDPAAEVRAPGLSGQEAGAIVTSSQQAKKRQKNGEIRA